MEKRQALTKVLAALLVLVFIVYIGYQIFSSLSDPITIVEGMLVTVEDRIAVEGVFFRSQSLVTGGEEKSMEYLVEDGEKVARGQDLAVYFDSGGAAGIYQQIQELNNRIGSLEYALKTLSGGADSAKVDALIYVEMQSVGKALEQGAAEPAAEHYSALSQLVISRGATQNDRTGYEEQLTALRAERAGLETALQGSVSRVQAEQSGYFFKMTDGYETELTPQTVRDMTPDRLEALTPGRASQSAGIVGTVVDTYEWYFAAVLSKEDAAAVETKGARGLGIYFAQIGGKSLSMKVDWIKTFDDGRAIVVFKSGVMDEKYLSTRFQSADIVLASYTGIKVPREALRQVNGQWGVYCLEGAFSNFKPVSWVYQTDSYVLVPSAANAKEGLYMYDKIIIRAKGLEDKKVVK